MNSLSRNLLIFFLMFYLFIHSITAQEKDSIKTLEEVIIIGETENLNHGLKITKIDSAILKQHTQGSLADLLASNSPIFIKYYGRGGLATASFRGTSASHTKLVWNGMDITSPMLGQADFSLIPIALSEEINIASGAASLTNTSGGLGGAILMNNNPRLQKHREISYLQGVASFGTHTESLNFSVSNTKIHSKTNIFHQFSDNDFKYFQRNELGNKIWKKQNNAAYRQYGFTNNLYLQPKKNQLISLNIWGQNVERAIPKLSANEGKDDINQQKDESLRMMVSWEYFFDEKQITLQSGYSYKTLEYYLSKALPFENQYYLSVDSYSTEKSLFYKATYQTDKKEIGGLHTNIQLQQHKVNNKENVSNLGFEKNRWELVYMFDVYFKINKKLIANIISRQELIDWKVISQPVNSIQNKKWINIIEDYILPKMYVLSINYQPILSIDWKIKSSISKNYRFPTLNDLYFQPGGNPNLKPEKGYTTEIGTILNKNKNNFNMITQFTAYYSWIDDWILWRPQTKGNWTPSNVQFVHARGIEVDIKTKLKKNKLMYFFSGNYAFSKTTAEKNYSSNNKLVLGKQLPYIPKHSADLSFKIEYQKWYIQYLFQFNSKRYATLQNSINYLSTLPNYFMSDVLIGKSLKLYKINFDFQFKVLNILNENYRTVLGRNMPMRNYELWVNIKF
ncbi:MAG: TonB-dependent receptor plug domain-containing protein [Flammeovirgaceae bacterium]